MISNSALAPTTGVLDTAGSTPATKIRKKRVGKVQLPAEHEEWLAARLFHPVKAVQKDLFSYLVCHRREFCTWLKLQYYASLQNKQPETGVNMPNKQEKLFNGVAGFTICVLNPEIGTASAQPVRVISNHPFVALPPAHARFKVIPVEVIFKSLQEVLGLAQPASQLDVKRALLPGQQNRLVTPNLGNLGRKSLVASIQTKQISLTEGATLLGVTTRTISRRRAQGESSYSPVADYQIFCELLGRTKKKVIASRQAITERTIWNIRERVLA